VACGAAGFKRLELSYEPERLWSMLPRVVQPTAVADASRGWRSRSEILLDFDRWSPTMLGRLT
jgi:hypothetical protein